MEVNRATISSGSVGTFRSHTTLPVSSTTHTAVSFTETSRPTKCVIAIAPSSLLEVTVTPIWSSHVEGPPLTYSATQPPRYTIFGVSNRDKQTLVHGDCQPQPSTQTRPSARAEWLRGLGVWQRRLPAPATDQPEPPVTALRHSLGSLKPR